MILAIIVDHYLTFAMLFMQLRGKAAGNLIIEPTEPPQQDL